MNEDLQAAVLETERHVGADGWGQSARPFALLRSTDLLAVLPESSPVVGSLADAVADSPEHLTPVELDARSGTAAEVLARIAWPGESRGGALVLEHDAIGVSADPGPEGERAAEPARLAVGVLWDGPAWCVVRFADGSLNGGDALVPDLIGQVRASGAELAT